MPRHVLGNHGVGKSLTFQVLCGYNRHHPGIVVGDVEVGRKDWRTCKNADEKRCKLGRHTSRSVCIRPRDESTRAFRNYKVLDVDRRQCGK